MVLFRRLALVVAGGLVLAGCSRSRPTPPPFGVLRVAPALDASAEPLLLNDAVTVYFTGDLMPVSITSDSVMLVDELGQSVPGTLRVGANWVTFQPKPPLSPELTDGSFRPGATYQLFVAGSPRPDAVRAADGRRLEAAAVFPVRIARFDQRPQGLPSLLRPPSSDLPFLMRAADEWIALPADQPRLRLHFTQPLLPTSVTPEAFTITLLGTPFVELVPRNARIVTSRVMDHLPGSTVEVDLGATPKRADGSAPLALHPGERLCVQIRASRPLLDYSGAEPLQVPPPQWFHVVEGDTVAVAEWPQAGDVIVGDDDLAPTFEVRGNVLRPRVRTEAGDGSLGVFRPQRDVTLRPGQAFDRGDGQLVVSRGGTFAFATIDIPEHVTVRVDATGAPVQLLALGGVRIGGTLRVAATPAPLPTRHAALKVDDLVQCAPLAIVTASDVEVRGRIVADSAASTDGSVLLIATAGAIDLREMQAELPFHTALAVEANAPDSGGAIRGPRGQSVVFAAKFTYGAAPGTDIHARALLPWRGLPADRDTAVVHFERDADVEVSLQWAPPDLARKQPDLGIGRVSSLQPVGERDTVALTAGAFVRLALSAHVVGGQEPPRLREVRLCDR